MIVFLIDDDSDFRMMVEEWVDDLNDNAEADARFELSATGDTENFFTSIVESSKRTERQIALVDLDIRGQKTAGLELLERIRKNGDDKIRLMPTVIYSNSSQSADVTDSYDKLANSYVWKGKGVEQREIFGHLVEFWRDTVLTPSTN